MQRIAFPRTGLSGDVTVPGALDKIEWYHGRSILGLALMVHRVNRYQVKLACDKPECGIFCCLFVFSQMFLWRKQKWNPQRLNAANLPLCRAMTGSKQPVVMSVHVFALAGCSKGPRSLQQQEVAMAWVAPPWQRWKKQEYTTEIPSSTKTVYTPRFLLAVF